MIDNVSDLTYRMKHRETYSDLTLFFLYVLISSFTILNMLIGVLVEVVGAVSAGEKEKSMISSVAEQLAQVFSDIDVDKSGMVSKLEFDQMVRNDTVRENLQQVGIQPKHLSLLADALFSADDDDVLVGQPGGEGSDDESLQLVVVSQQHSCSQGPLCIFCKVSPSHPTLVPNRCWVVGVMICGMGGMRGVGGFGQEF